MIIELLNHCQKKDRRMQFMIQEYRSGSNKARYYLRLEKDGVFKGWAIPKGLPIKWKDQHLAIQVGDFKLEAAGFEGKVEESKFGPGTIAIFDRGEYRVCSWEDDKIIFDLSGSRARGSFALSRFPRPGPGHWLLGQTKPCPQSPSLKKREASPLPSIDQAPPVKHPSKIPFKEDQSSKYPPKSVWHKPAKSRASAKTSQPRSRPQPRRRRHKKKNTLPRWLDKKRHNREGQMAGWLMFAFIGIGIIGFIKLIQYIISIL
ncbi:MAG: DNA polymerase ligase N-terminal domain-containing protein [PVC group bacterium]